jgi:oxalate decarboxylase
MSWREVSFLTTLFQACWKVYRQGWVANHCTVANRKLVSKHHSVNNVLPTPFKMNGHTKKPSPHVFNLKDAKPFFESELGSLQRVTVDELPILKNLSLKRLVLAPKAIREPHWHANANELTYCLSGKVLVSVLDNLSQYASFIIEAGEMFHVESGSLHSISNLSDTEEAELLVSFRHEKPEDFSLGAALGAMTPAVLGNTYNLPSEAFSNIRLSTEDKKLVKREGDPTIPSTAHLPDPHKFRVEFMEPPLKGEGVGLVRPARKQFWPSLHNIAMYSLVVEDTGMREPHWHPITAEMGYVHRGAARMTILDPDGTTDTYTLKEGDMYFIPPAYPHHIETLPEGGKDIHFCIFFDQPSPQDIGYKASATAIPHEVMAATLGVSRAKMPDLELAVTDPLIIARVNAVDPVV